MEPASGWAETAGYERRVLEAPGLLISTPALAAGLGDGASARALERYPSMLVPRYRPVDGARWDLRLASIPAGRAYFTRTRPVAWEQVILSRDGRVWMTLMPLEVESHLAHLAAAAGTVVICGLGLGMMAYATAARVAVDRVIVIELDPEVVEVVQRSAGLDDWPHRDKIEIVVADARQCRWPEVDLVYVDIWPTLGEAGAAADVRRVASNIPAARYGYWGQELDLVTTACADGRSFDQVDAAAVARAAETTGLPLVGVDDPDYATLCRLAAVNHARA